MFFFFFFKKNTKYNININNYIKKKKHYITITFKFNVLYIQNTKNNNYIPTIIFIFMKTYYNKNDNTLIYLL